MSLSCSDLFSDLLCSDESAVVFSISGDDEEPPEYSSDELQSCEAESIVAGLLEEEGEHLAGVISPPSSTVDAYLRAESIAWILKVQAYFGFQPLTAYLAVNYFDRFLNSHPLTKLNGWPLQLLTVACLSLAAKMEEIIVPSLLDLQIEGTKFMFEAKSVQRMELLVLSVLDWRLRCITPFCYLSFFALKIDPSGVYNAFLVSRAKDIILSTIQGSSSSMDYRASCVAVSSILCAAHQLPTFSSITAQHAEKWSHGRLHKDNIMSCYKNIQQMANKNKKQSPKGLTHYPLLNNTSSSSSSSVDSSSSSSTPCNKRRKLDNRSWDEESNHDKGNSLIK